MHIAWTLKHSGLKNWEPDPRLRVPLLINLQSNPGFFPASGITH
jgi:hypothetical protein